MMSNVRRLVIPSAMLIFLFAFLAHSQTITGSISGRVLDSQMAVIGGATVTITEASRNFTTTTMTGEDGSFLSAGLLPGNYSISVDKPGFKKARIETPLNANDKLNVGNLQLEVGGVSETVEVSAEVALLQTESVERAAIITGKQIENIEVNGRNPLDLAKLAPGVLSTANFSLGGINGLNNINVNGNRGSQNQVMINGIGAVDSGNNGQQSVV